MFSSTRCPWCVRAKDLLKSQGIECEVVELDTLPQNQRASVYQELISMTNQRTVPNIFIKGKKILSKLPLLISNLDNKLNLGQHVGGYDSIAKMHSDNLLKHYAQQEQQSK